MKDTIQDHDKAKIFNEYLTGKGLSNILELYLELEDLHHTITELDKQEATMTPKSAYAVPSTSLSPKAQTPSSQRPRTVKDITIDTSGPSSNGDSPKPSVTPKASFRVITPKCRLNPMAIVTSSHALLNDQDKPNSSTPTRLGELKSG